MVYNSMDSRVTSWSGCLLLLGRRLVVFFSTAADQVSGSTAQWNGISSWNIFPPKFYEFESVFIIKIQTPIFHLFRLKMVLRDKFPPIRLQIRMRWICFGHFIENKSKRHSQGQLRIFSRFPTAGVATTTSDAFGWWSPVNTVTTWTETLALGYSNV